tara:strand:- start:407 stop:898 length:492 start_codon:yes stop_codon:yes gene_type:complete
MLISQNFNGISISICVDNEEFEKNKENFTELNQICSEVMSRVSILMLHSNEEDDVYEESIDALTESESETDEDDDDDNLTVDSDERDKINLKSSINNEIILSILQKRNAQDAIEILKKEETDLIYIENTTKSDRLWVHENLCNDFEIRSIHTNGDFVLSFKKL